jgi:predicted nucleotidyltransferase
MVNVNLDKSINEIVTKYAELLKQELSIQGIYLYGSYVKGTFTKDSDIDIAVVSMDFTGNPIDDMLKLMRIRRKVDYRIEPHPFKVEDFDQGDPYIREIITQGIKVA